MTRTMLMAAVLAGLVAGLAGAAGAQSAADAITQRQAGYKAMGAATGDIKKALDAGADLTALASKAADISAFAKRIPTLFPAGSGAESGVKTRALAAIWQNKSDFEAHAGMLGTAADKLAMVLKANDATAAKAAFSDMTGQCGACHRTYRAPQ